MNDERLGQEISDFYRQTDVRPRDSKGSAREVAARLPQVEQVKRRRWLPTQLTRAIHEPSPIPATNGHTPTVIGRTTSMLSPVKAITAGALIFAIGGVMLVAQPFQQQSSAPGAETEAVAPTWVTGNVQPAPSCSSGDLEVDGDVQRNRNVECTPQTWTSSDPRLTGEVARRWNYDAYQTDAGGISVWMDAAYLRNDEGGWACSSSSLAQDGVDVADPWTFSCIGDGGYAGLSASLVLVDAGGNSEEFVGLIFSGDFPPLPEPPATE
jgi:hypothetical protein